MRMNEYQTNALKTCLKESWNLYYLVLGLTGEAGELANKVKKVLRDNDGYIDVQRKAMLANELGDVLWYIAVLARFLGFSLEDVAEANLIKLANRQKEDKIHGDGDER